MHLQCICFIVCVQDTISKFASLYLDDIFSSSVYLNTSIMFVQSRSICSKTSCMLGWITLSFHASAVSFLGVILLAGSITMNPEKTEPLKEWPVSESCKQPQYLLRYAKFCCRWVSNYSSTGAPLHQQISSKNSFVWSLAADQVFTVLKRWFTLPAVLILMDPTSQFVVEATKSHYYEKKILYRKIASWKLLENQQPHESDILPYPVRTGWT